jgi:hypothetical protein
MRHKKPPPFLVKSNSTRANGRKRPFVTGEPIPESGIYRVLHDTHRLPHEVTLFSDQVFPRCAKCKDAVKFELIHAATDLLNEHGFRVNLYELDDQEDSTIAA